MPPDGNDMSIPQQVTIADTYAQYIGSTDMVAKTGSDEESSHVDEP